jgi:hypothetical protein
MMDATEKPRFEEWCILELFGHQRIAGRVSEQVLGSGSFIRVDVPSIDDKPGFTRLYGASAIYSVTVTDEQTARLAVKAYQVQPLERWTIQDAMRQLPQHEEEQ